MQVATFLMGRFPVTVHEYGAYLRDQALEPPGGMQFEEQMEHPSRPLVNVTWHEAREYCQWAGGRLPTEEEWEYAAGGKDSLRYPWGDEPEPTAADDLANSYGKVGSPSPVGLFPAGAQRDTGILDMAGNVWEWTTSPSGEYQVVRGGSFYLNAGFLRAAYRYVVVPGGRSDVIGFRCVREVFP